MMKLATSFLLALAVLPTGCKKEAPTAVVVVVDAAPPPSPPDAAPTPSVDAAVASKGAHGGVLATSEAGSLELVASKGGEFWLYLSDAAGAARPTKGLTATVKLDAAGYEPVVLKAHEDHLMGKGKAIEGSAAVAEVTVEGGAKPETARFTLQLEAAKPAGDHGHEHGEGGHDHGGHDEGKPHKH
jgi:hypothetical protein